MTMLIVLLAIAFVVAAAFTLFRGRSHTSPFRTQVRPVLFRHPIRPVLPASLQAMIQDGFLEATFDNALRPDFLFPAAAIADPVQGNVGQRVTRTRTGLLAPTAPAIAHGVRQRLED